MHTNDNLQAAPSTESPWGVPSVPLIWWERTILFLFLKISLLFTFLFLFPENRKKRQGISLMAFLFLMTNIIIHFRLETFLIVSYVFLFCSRKLSQKIKKIWDVCASSVLLTHDHIQVFPAYFFSSRVFTNDLKRLIFL